MIHSLMTATVPTAGRKSREVTLSYLGELLQNAGFIDEKQKVDFTNESSVPHNVSIEKGEDEVGKTKVVTGGNASTTATLKAGKYTYYCSVDGHEQAGMKGTLTGTGS